MHTQFSKINCYYAASKEVCIFLNSLFLSTFTFLHMFSTYILNDVSFRCFYLLTVVRVLDVPYMGRYA